jgi:K+-transporting ATPase ATPase A chain
MTANGWFQIGLYLILLLAITKPMGVYMARVFSGEKRLWIRYCVPLSACCIA